MVRGLYRTLAAETYHLILFITMVSEGLFSSVLQYHNYRCTGDNVAPSTAASQVTQEPKPLHLFLKSC